MTLQNPYSSPEATPSRMIDHDRRSLYRCVVVSAISGCIWAAIVYFLASQWMGTVIVGGVLASPFIGVGVGLIHRPAYNKSPLARVGMALVTLYFAAALFGTAVGIYDAMWPIPNRLPDEVVRQSVMATLWGVTFTGFFLFLWPLSFANHWLVGRISGYSPSRDAGSKS